MSGSAAAALRTPVFLQGELLPDAFTISPTASWRMLLTPCVSQPTCSALITVSPCVNKYPGVDRSSVPVLHHQGVQSGGRPLLSCSRADRNHDYTVSTVVIHLLPKLRHHTPSYAPTHTQRCTHIQKRNTLPLTNKCLQIFGLSFPLFFSLQCSRLYWQHAAHVAICTLRISLQQCLVTANYYCCAGLQH